MTCLNCGQPIYPCASHGGCDHGGWLHSRTSLHACGTDPFGDQRATPTGGPLPAVQEPTEPPGQEVA